MYYWFTTWFLLNIIVTVLNKVLFDHFDFSYLSLSEYHMITTALLSFVVIRNSGTLKFDKEFTIKMVLLSSLFSLNVILGNASMSYCSLAFAQLVKCTKPIITAILSYLILKKNESLEVWISLIPVVFGAVFVTVGELKLTVLGFILTVSGNIFSGLKGVMVKKYLSGEKSVPPMNLVFYTSFYGSILSLIGQMLFDKNFPRSFVPNSSKVAIVILFQSICAFFLNYSNFEANKETNPILLNIGGNVKQVLMVLFSVYYFQSPMSYTGILGAIITIIGAIWYGYVKDPTNYNVLSPYTPR